LFPRKIIKIVDTRCPILKLKCTKFDYGWGSAPDPAGRAYNASPPDPLAGFKRAYFVASHPLGQVALADLAFLEGCVTLGTRVSEH